MDAQVDTKHTKEIMVKVVTSLLSKKPADPVPHIYSYLLELKKGTDPSKISPITVNELNEIKNLKKKIEYYKEILNEAGDESEHTPTEESDEEVEDIQPKKKNIKAQRKGVSAEVYGEFNKKENFTPKVVPKSD